jgi:hypothetical protein
MPNYGNGKIYTIRCRTDDTMIYVGSTTQSLAVRWGSHKKDSRNEICKNRLIYKTINGDWNNWYIELYELYPCNCKEELCKKEGEIIRLIATLNHVIPCRTKKEYDEKYRYDNKGKISEYRNDNKEYYKNYNKEYHDNNKEYYNKYNKEWYEANKEKRKAYNKEYRLRKKLEKQQQSQQ